ncbi:phosphoadenylyl-sulfate reductase [Sediminibacterium ginsengisoli]|uniref:Adenosine 5'-phosphosulfate reductase n=1 Tax=Sediminibacterium ginsengisoli TaxID=413434 RepID=A0A1T4MAG3_9BACT|nr:phosphoadenylyl-sulfate reductase [Sediminibacterium ginsengisoli]SJZ63704.1 phosphoadenylylsulfate reductase (thioredoxin) [Sediminibacterium ginsengisoli]
MVQINSDAAAALLQQLEGKSETEAIVFLAARFPGEVTFSTSFSMEDQVITDLISCSGAGVSCFTLDTGRMFPETYSTWTRTSERYNMPIVPYYPDTTLLETFIGTNGPDAFYRSPELRSECCRIRKVIPLKRALTGKKIWITGLRAAHSPGRNHMQLLEWDETNQLIKYQPLLHWTNEEVSTYIHSAAIPYNPLHDKGFVSIGCAPCTRAIQPGEDFRAGRWWWEDNSKKECGLHTHKAN